MIPPVSIDGATPYYATGPGLTYLNQTYLYPTVTFYPNGSTSGDVVIYIGSATGRLPTCARCRSPAPARR